jgi:hypothetical protein
MAKGYIHTVFKDGQWVNEIVERHQFGSRYGAEEVVDAGHVHAIWKRTEHVAEDGTIGERHSSRLRSGSRV